MKIPRDFYLQEDVLQISKDLLGKLLCTNINGSIVKGIITETEAYMAPEDKASHAYNNRRTPRTEMFYKQGGISYVYLCYGIHHLFNIITNKGDVPHAILVRAVEPVEGIDIMLARRNKPEPVPTLTAGPGALSVALGITCDLNGTDLAGDTIWLEDPGMPAPEIVAGPRVGIAYAKEYALKPWRFRIRGSKWTSKPA